MKSSFFAATAVAFIELTGSAQAATLSGTFYTVAVNAVNQTSAQSEATASNYLNALYQANIFFTPGYAWDDFFYTGDIFFGTDNGPTADSATTIAQWLASAGGVVSDLDAAFGALQQSKGDIKDGTATTTFYVFYQVDPFGPFLAPLTIGPSNFTVTHDDGFGIFQLNTLIGGFNGPNTVRTTFVPGYPGGEFFTLLYVATDSDPSILKVDVAPVPLPAALPLLAAGLAGLGLLGLRGKAA